MFIAFAYTAEKRAEISVKKWNKNKKKKEKRRREKE